MQYQIRCVFQEINVSKLTKNQLKVKKVIQCCLFSSLPAHLREMGPVLVWSLYELNCSFCTYGHTVLLHNLPHFYDLLEVDVGDQELLGDWVIHHLSSMSTWQWCVITCLNLHIMIDWGSYDTTPACCMHHYAMDNTFPCLLFIQSSLYLVPTF